MRAINLLAGQIVLVSVRLADRIYVRCASFVEVDAIPGIVLGNLERLCSFVGEVLNDLSALEHAARQGGDENGRGASGDDFAGKSLEVCCVLRKGDAGIFFLVVVAELLIVSCRCFQP
jgi:hypothetical protein